MYNRCILLKLFQQTTESNKLCFAAFLHSDRIIYGKIDLDSFNSTPLVFTWLQNHLIGP